MSLEVDAKKVFLSLAAIATMSVTNISAAITPGAMMAYATEKGWHIDEAERKNLFLLHQRVKSYKRLLDLG